MDPFKYHSSGLESPALYAQSITPSDSADLPYVPRAIYSLTDGQVSIVTSIGVTVTLPMIAGIPLPFRAVRVRATGTTATGLVGVW